MSRGANVVTHKSELPHSPQHSTAQYSTPCHNTPHHTASPHRIVLHGTVRIPYRVMPKMRAFFWGHGKLACTPRWEATYMPQGPIA